MVTILTTQLISYGISIKEFFSLENSHFHDEVYDKLKIFLIINCIYSYNEFRYVTGQVDLNEFFQFFVSNKDIFFLDTQATQVIQVNQFSLLSIPENRDSVLGCAREESYHIMIQAEQKQHAEIKDGFEELHRQLPTSNYKMSKAVLLQKAVLYLKNQSRKESFLLDEVNRLTQVERRIRKGEKDECIRKTKANS
ncbi:HLH-domain-containing protein [Gigaspora margarita]|uniref:HLH-domain-containing protein n=1 Tax=Gigaspora margarita TaxID=4874 RepID=A0A8H3XA07_GIGMA|nr:HLH-domain-containing protein [Gigaspora margarita]